LFPLLLLVVVMAVANAKVLLQSAVLSLLMTDGAAVEGTRRWRLFASTHSPTSNRHHTHFRLLL
jgi:hypothetical protein